MSFTPSVNDTIVKKKNIGFIPNEKDTIVKKQVVLQPPDEELTRAIQPKTINQPITDNKQFPILNKVATSIELERPQFKPQGITLPVYDLSNYSQPVTAERTLTKPTVTPETKEQELLTNRQIEILPTNKEQKITDFTEPVGMNEMQMYEWKKSKYKNNELMKAMRKTPIPLAVSFVSRISPKFQLSPERRVALRAFEDTYPIQSYIGKTLADIAQIGAVSEGGALLGINKYINIVTKGMSPFWSSIAGRAMHSATTFGMYNGLEELKNQSETGKWDFNKFITSTAKGIGFGAFLGGVVPVASELLTKPTSNIISNEFMEKVLGVEADDIAGKITINAYKNKIATIISNSLTTGVAFPAWDIIVNNVSDPKQLRASVLTGMFWGAYGGAGEFGARKYVIQQEIAKYIKETLRETALMYSEDMYRKIVTPENKTMTLLDYLTDKIKYPLYDKIQEKLNESPTAIEFKKWIKDNLPMSEVVTEQAKELIKTIDFTRTPDIVGNFTSELGGVKLGGFNKPKEEPIEKQPHTTLLSEEPSRPKWFDLYVEPSKNPSFSEYKDIAKGISEEPLVTKPENKEPLSREEKIHLRLFGYSTSDIKILKPENARQLIDYQIIKGSVNIKPDGNYKLNEPIGIDVSKDVEPMLNPIQVMKIRMAGELKGARQAYIEASRKMTQMTKDTNTALDLIVSESKNASRIAKKQTTENIQELRNKLAEYVKKLPNKRYRNEILSKIKLITTEQGLNREFIRTDRLAYKLERNTLINTIKDLYKDTQTNEYMDVTKKKMAQDLMEQYTTKKYSDEKLKEIRNSKEYVEKELSQGKELPLLNKKRWSEIKDLDKTNIRDLSNPTLANLVNELGKIRNEGNLKYKVNNTIAETKLQNDIKETTNNMLSNGSPIFSPMERNKLYPVGERPEGFSEYKLNAIQQKNDMFWLLKSRGDLATSTFSNIFKLLGCPQLFDRFNAGYNKWIGAYNPTIERFAKLNKDGRFTRNDRELLGMYALAKRAIEGSVEYKDPNIINGMLERFSFTRPIILKLEKINSTRATPISLLDYMRLIVKDFEQNAPTGSKQEKLKSYYDEWHKWTDATFPQIQKLAKELYNIDLGKDQWYFPIYYDWANSKNPKLYEKGENEIKSAQREFNYGDIVKRLFGIRTDANFSLRNVKKNFIEDIKGASYETPLELDFNKVMLGHIKDVYYFLNLAKELKSIGGIVNSDVFANRAGGEGTKIARQIVSYWVNNGGTDGKKVREVEKITKKIVSSRLLFNIGTALIQPTSIVDVMGVIGIKPVINGLIEGFNPKFRNMIIEFPTLKYRVGEDPIIDNMLSSNNFLNKMVRVGYFPTKTLDYWTAEWTVASAYLKYFYDHPDISLNYNKVNPEAQAYAEKILEQTQGSQFIKDRTLAQAFGRITGSESYDRALLAYMNFMLKRWNNIRYSAWKYGIQEGFKRNIATIDNAKYVKEGNDWYKLTNDKYDNEVKKPIFNNYENKELLNKLNSTKTQKEIGSIGQGAGSMFFLTIGSSMIEAILREEIKRKRNKIMGAENKPLTSGEMLKIFSSTLGGNIPLISNMIGMTNYGNDLFPALTMVTQATDVVKSIGTIGYNIATGNKTKKGTTKEAINAGLGVLGAFTGLPTGEPQKFINAKMSAKPPLNPYANVETEVKKPKTIYRKKKFEYPKVNY